MGHEILLRCLEVEVGMKEHTLDWFLSLLMGRTEEAAVGDWFIPVQVLSVLWGSTRFGLVHHAIGSLCEALRRHLLWF